MPTTPAPRPPLPPFTRETAAQKVRLAEDAWNTRDPQRVALAYTVDTIWRNRAEFPVGREQVQAFLERKWARELDYRLIKELWAFDGPTSPCALPTSGATTPVTGSAPMATRTGSSTSTATCIDALPASTISPSPRRTASSTGRRAGDRTSIRA